MSGEASKGTGRPGVRLNRARRGPITTALDESLEELAGSGRMRGDVRVFAALARRTALVVDAAWRADDHGAVMRATKELRELVDLLPLREPTAPGDGEEGSDRDSDEPRARVLELLDSPARVGD